MSIIFWFATLFLSVISFFYNLDKRCSKASSYDIKSNIEKIWRAIFSNSALILGAKQLFHNL
ncbi:MAG: hypothetical protein E7153_00485 [Enterococcus faecium]|nr:hypothetical protein [Enterococcus faecium]MBO1086449.1 hypothetical protein [Enterococcus mundtii]